MYIDFHCYPVVERMIMLENSPWNHGFDALGMKDCPTVYAYVHRFRQHPLLAPHVITQEAYNKFLTKISSNEVGVPQSLTLEFIQ